MEKTEKKTCSGQAHGALEQHSMLQRLLLRTTAGLGTEEPGKTGAPCVKVPGSSRVPSQVIQDCRYGEAQAAAASWRAHDGRRQRGTACPHLYRYRLTHTYCSLDRLPPTHPFVGAPILQRHFQVPCRARLPPPRVLLPHTCTQDGWFLQPKRRPARLPRRPRAVFPYS